MERAKSSLPVPLSPSSNTLASDLAARWADFHHGADLRALADDRGVAAVDFGFETGHLPFQSDSRSKALLIQHEE